MLGLVALNVAIWGNVANIIATEGPKKAQTTHTSQKSLRGDWLKWSEIYAKERNAGPHDVCELPE